GGVGLTFGVLCGFATQVRIDQGGGQWVKVAWLAGVLLVAGISARMLFVFALSHGAGPAIRTFRIVHHIGAAAWPVALVSMSMALREVSARIAMVHVCRHRFPTGRPAAPRRRWATPRRRTVSARASR